MANYPYVIFGCDCNPKCVCMLCGVKAADCKYANCKDCDKIEGHKGCQNKPDEAGH
jgi:hypothetical protein